MFNVENFCWNGTNARESEINILTASCIVALDGNDVVGIWRQCCQSFGVDGDALVCGEVSCFLKRDNAIEVNGDILIVVNACLEGV